MVFIFIAVSRILWHNKLPSSEWYVSESPFISLSSELTSDDSKN